MSPAMLKIEEAPSGSQTIPHLLPCRVHYDGPVEPIQSYWNPSQAKDGKKVAYLRGRKLHGKTVRLPEGYRGVVLQKGEAKKSTSAQHHHETAVAGLDDERGEDAPVEEPETESLEGRAGFEELVVWGHESMADAASDPFVRGLEEWLELADKIHSHPASQES